MLQYDLDSRKSGSLYEELVRRMRADIAQGVIAPDEHLPSKRDFARSLGVSVITVEHAYQQLVAEGYVRAIQRKGYFANDVGSFAAKMADSLSSAASVKKRADTGFASVGSDLVLGAALEENRALKDAGLGAPQGASSASATGDPVVLSLAGIPRVLFDLSGGVAPDSFPRQAWSRIVREVVEDAPDELLLKSAPREGLPELRRAIAHYVARARDMQVEPWQVIVGAGAQGLYPVLPRLLGRTRFAVEDPGYPTLARTYAANKVEVAQVAMDEKGIDVDALRASGAQVVHVMPSHHFPTGAVMPIARRYELLAWASEGEGRYIIEDDYDCEFRHQGRPIPALQGIDAAERVVYLNTFARTVAPSLRLGFMVLPAHLAERFRDEWGGEASSVSAIEQMALSRFLSEGAFDKHVNRMRRHYREVRDSFLEGLDGLSCSALGKDAGLHFVLDCEAPLDEECLKAELLEEGVRVRTLSDYFGSPSDSGGVSVCRSDRSEALGKVAGTTSGQGKAAASSTKLVICYSGLSASDAAEAAQRVRCVIERLRPSHA
ncbi:MAG: PLP-dependent aminotransferase family protein [Coriobacteriia bacterium]|nr:PLP-dependent aminotransferase family protein [Coriobacteriia bacterium]